MLVKFCLLTFLSNLALSRGDHRNAPCIDGQCDSGYTCHPTNDICVKDATPTSKLHVWLGDGPNECNRHPSDCQIFDMDFDTTHMYGGIGEWCASGEKVRCTVRDVRPLDPPTPDNELRVIAYNIFERAWYISMDGQRERTCRIPSAIAAMHPNVDVITIQENFIGGCFKDQCSMRDLLTNAGFPYQTETIRSPNKVENGGIYVASRWPILEEDQFTFESAYVFSWDYFSAKGVSYAKIQKGSQVYHVMGTHFQSGKSDEEYEARFNQSVEWAVFVAKKNIPPGEGVVFSGDFNANYWDGPGGHFFDIMNNLQAEVPRLVGPVNGSASNAQVNDIQRLKGKTGWGKWIDHVVYSKNHRLPIDATVEILVPEGDTAFPVCWCEGCINPLRWSYTYATPHDCPDEVEHIKSLADHQAVMGTFIF